MKGLNYQSSLLWKPLRMAVSIVSDSGEVGLAEIIAPPFPLTLFPIYGIRLVFWHQIHYLRVIMQHLGNFQQETTLFMWQVISETLWNKSNSVGLLNKYCNAPITLALFSKCHNTSGIQLQGRIMDNGEYCPRCHDDFLLLNISICDRCFWEVQQCKVQWQQKWQTKAMRTLELETFIAKCVVATRYCCETL